ncbi:hypothetical protein HZS_4601 [Henneguya salminicola]|nr:hypothetical protein HZS_4601 [Henneguya salminicola]
MGGNTLHMGNVPELSTINPPPILPSETNAITSLEECVNEELNPHKQEYLEPNIYNYHVKIHKMNLSIKAKETKNVNVNEYGSNKKWSKGTKKKVTGVSRQTQCELTENIFENELVKKAIKLQVKKCQEYKNKAIEAHARKDYNYSSYNQRRNSYHRKIIENIIEEEFIHQFLQRYLILVQNGSFDMHRFSIVQAIDSLELILNPVKYNLQLSRHKYIDVITGRGIHSENNNPRLKPAIILYLKKNDLKFTEINIGCIRVDLKTK